VWLKVVVVALAPLLVAMSAPGQVFLRCQMDGILRHSCCPPDQATLTSMPALQTQSCCDREVADETAAAEPGRTAVTDFVATTVLSLSTPISLAAADVVRAPPVQDSHGPPRDGPSIVLLKRAFLI
jgi:hypothetical protein